MRYLILITMIFNLSHAFAAAQLDASLEQYQIGIGEKVNLHITLSQFSDPVVEQPDISVLQNDFKIYGSRVQQSSTIINGRISQEISWIYSIEPLKQGELTIPSISLKTTAGVLSTKTLKLQVSQAGAPRQDGIELQVKAANLNPYLYEPIYVKLRLSHLGDLRDPEPVLPNNIGVVFENISNMSAKKEVINGRTMIVHEIEYLLTPMQSGLINLNLIKMQASKLDRSHNRQFGGFFGFDSYQPVVITAEPIELNVKTPDPSQAQNWLPLLNLKLDTTWESDIEQPVTVGMPLIRTIKIIASGMGGQPFPDLEKLITGNNDFRIRHSKPEIERKLIANTYIPATFITQSLSIIPLKIGQVTIPKLRIPWWDTNAQKLSWAEIPEQILMVQANPNEILQTQATPVNAQSNIPATPTTTPTKIIVISQSLNPIQFSLLGMSIIALLIALFQSWWKKQPNTSKVTTIDHNTLSQKQFKQQLSNALTAQQIQVLLQQFAHEQWQLPKNSALNRIGKFMQQQYTYGEKLAELLKILEKALYAEQITFDLAQWKQDWLIIWKQARPISDKMEKIPSSIGSLNPV